VRASREGLCHARGRLFPSFRVVGSSVAHARPRPVSRLRAAHQAPERSLSLLRRAGARAHAPGLRPGRGPCAGALRRAGAGRVPRADGVPLGGALRGAARAAARSGRRGAPAHGHPGVWDPAQRDAAAGAAGTARCGRTASSAVLCAGLRTPARLAPAACATCAACAACAAAPHASLAPVAPVAAAAGRYGRGGPVVRGTSARVASAPRRRRAP
jgi:hypothetical protein